MTNLGTNTLPEQVVPHLVHPQYAAKVYNMLLIHRPTADEILLFVGESCANKKPVFGFFAS